MARVKDDEGGPRIAAAPAPGSAAAPGGAAAGAGVPATAGAVAPVERAGNAGSAPPADAGETEAELKEHQMYDDEREFYDDERECMMEGQCMMSDDEGGYRCGAHIVRQSSEATS